MKNRKTILIGAVMVVLAALAIIQVPWENMRSGATETAAKPGYLAPSFELAGWDGKDYKAGGKRDKPLLVNFWASWCAPCHIEAPDLQALYETFEGKLDLYGINVTTLDTRTGIEEFIREYGLTFPILLDQTGEVTGKKFLVDGYPASFLIDQDGVIVDAVFGVIDRSKLEKQIRRLLSEG